MSNKSGHACFSDQIGVASHVAELVRRKKTPVIVGISGIECSGKSTFAAQLATELETKKLQTLVISIDDFLFSRQVRNARENQARGYYDDTFDFSTFFSLLESARVASQPAQKVRVFDWIQDIQSERFYSFVGTDVVIVEGVFLFRRPQDAIFDFKIWLDLDFYHSLQRARNRERDICYYPDQESICHRYLTRFFPGQQLHFLLDEPMQNSHCIISQSQQEISSNNTTANATDSFPSTGEIFDAINQVSKEYLSFIEAHLNPQGQTFEFGCGTGRWLIPLAKSGFSMTGVDHDPEMLRLARLKVVAENLNHKVKLSQSTFQEFEPQGPMGNIFFSTDTICMSYAGAEWNVVIKRLAKYLMPSGKFLLFLNNPAKYLQHPAEFLFRSGQIPGKGTISVFEKRVVDLVGGCRVGYVEERFSPFASSAQSLRLRTRPLTIIEVDEVKRCLENCGITITAMYGSFDCEPLTPQSSKALIVGEK